MTKWRGAILAIFFTNYPRGIYMDDNLQEQLDLDFSYLIFQPDPRRDKVYAWINGEKYKKTYKTYLFCKLLHAKNPELFSRVQQVLNTYSFYLIAYNSLKVRKLDPSSKETLYKDQLTDYFTGKVDRKNLKDKERTFIDELSDLGFSLTSEEDIKEMRIGLTKQRNSGSILDRLSSMLRRK